MRVIDNIIKESGILNEMARGKIKIAIDENIEGTVNYLIEKGFSVLKPEKGWKDKKVHNWLEENNIKVFFTKNWEDFKKFQKEYVLYGIRINRPNYILADAIECIMRKKFNEHYELYVQREKGKYLAVVLDDLGLKIFGCKM
ncbi:MAG: hypothetical protein HQK91_13900 [Nitrospirae bacterium]|nr:hypothetical protein [Nitrospirota bacterium]MBF0542530.1 hypothetical protein [Nitrospirota bacterium]